jgi:hypothetical protein
MQACLDLRNQAHAHAEKYSQFFSYLLKQYNAKFQEYFQEIYDADMQDIKADMYEDSPAGFRLVYKHGRSNASLWSMAYTEQDYIEMLVQFFLATEPQLAADFDWELARQVLSDITTSVINHIRGLEFIQTAFARMAKAHGNGSLKKGELTEESRWVENETNLLVFILDVLKTDPQITETSVEKEDPYLLMSSPTHAFILEPSFEELKKGWQEDIFTYSWVRDSVIKPGKEFYEKITLSSLEQQFLLSELSKKIPVPGLDRLFLSESASVEVFRAHIIKTIPIADLIDSFLFEMLPLYSGGHWKEAVYKLLEGLDSTSLAQTLDRFPDFCGQIICTKQLKSLAKAIYMLAKDTCLFSFDLHATVAKNASLYGYAPPAPLLFADTNWVGSYFGFVVNPGTCQLELWRLDKTGSKGSPMSMWKRYVNGQDKKTWNIYSRYTEYK